ncbi:hypothetical protein SESBI_00488 [Sesbania bispinosa]|nr:hypothetical protein SESBI_00488 [Sesbania bispinosa]
MEATTMMNVGLGLGCCKLSWGRQRKQRMNIIMRCGGDRDRDHHMGGRLVDENMIVLRLRIKEIETNQNQNEGGGGAPNSDWMEWEKLYYAHHYYQDVYKAMGLLQSYFMSLRPTLAFGMLAFLAFSITISSGLAFFHALHIARTLFSCVNY